MTATLLHYEFQSDTAQLASVRERVRDALRGYGCTDEFVETCVLAVDEAVSNVMRHGYGLGTIGDLSLGIAVDGAQLVFRLRDFAEPFEQSSDELPSAGEFRAGGYGRLLMHEIMDSVEYGGASDGNGNLLEMRRRVEQDPRQQQERQTRADK